MKITLLISVILISLLSTSCRLDETINSIQNGDIDITTPSNSFAVDNDGNINFNCYVTNTSSSNNPDLTAKMNFSYSSIGFDTGYSDYESMNGLLRGASPGNHTLDDMVMPSLSTGCCNQCCPGYYQCVIEGYDSQNNLIDRHSVQVHIDASGNLNIKQ